MTPQTDLADKEEAFLAARASDEKITSANLTWQTYEMFLRSMWNSKLGGDDLKGSYMLGLVGESYELYEKLELGGYDEKKQILLDEGGDVVHYLLSLGLMFGIVATEEGYPQCPSIGIVLDRIALEKPSYPGQIDKTYISLLKASAKLADTVKKAVYHGAVIHKNEFTPYYFEMWASLYLICNFHGVDVFDLAKGNTDKLNERHASGAFSNAYHKKEKPPIWDRLFRKRLSLGMAVRALTLWFPEIDELGNQMDEPKEQEYCGTVPLRFINPAQIRMAELNNV